MIGLENRITPKFRNSKNFKNILDFLTTYDTESFAILSEANNLDSNYDFVLDEIGKTLGVYPRPYVPQTIGGFPTVFTLDYSRFDTVPFGDENGAYRKMSNLEYSKLLKIYAKLSDFNGTINEWEDIIFIATGARCMFENYASRFGITILKQLDILEKSIIEYSVRKNLLTVSIDFIGTTNGQNVFQLDATGFDTSEFVTPWNSI